MNAPLALSTVCLGLETQDQRNMGAENMKRAWEAYSRLQDHVTAMRDHVAGAEACLAAMPFEDTIPESHYRALAKELSRLAETCERRADRRAKRRAA